MASQIIVMELQLNGSHMYAVTMSTTFKWMPVVGELLTLKREPENYYDCYAVAVMKNEHLVDHIPIAAGRLVSNFFGKG